MPVSSGHARNRGAQTSSESICRTIASASGRRPDLLHTNTRTWVPSGRLPPRLPVCQSCVTVGPPSDGNYILWET